MPSESVSPFVLQKIRERKALKESEEEEPKEEEPEEDDEEDVEEDEEKPMTFEESRAKLQTLKPDTRARLEGLGFKGPGALEGFLKPKSHHAIGETRSHRARSSGASLTDRAGKFFKNLSPTQTWLLVGGGLLMANHLMVPRGTSILSKMLNAVAPAPPPRRLPVYRAGANLEAGWNRGAMPYGPWAHAAPGGPSPYAHADDTWGW